jgi:hypothetical protein
VFELWAEIDRSHHKFAHRGSYLNRFWASPTTVRRALSLHDKHFRPPPEPGRGQRRPFQEWAEYRSNLASIRHDTLHGRQADRHPRRGPGVPVVACAYRVR